MRRVLAAALLAIACASACARDAPPPAAGDASASSAADSTAIPLIDTLIPPAVAGEDGWNYRQDADADLDGDGTAERVVLTARVEMSRGRPLWDDGQAWQVYIEAADGRRTYLYAQRLQLGTLTLRIGLGATEGAATVVLLEHLPDRMSLYEISYAGPGRASVWVRFQRDTDPRGESASPRLP